MRRFWKITGLVIIILLLLVVLSTSLVRRSSYFNEDYYKITKDRFDSIRTAMTEVKGTVEAGFSKINITPVIIWKGNSEVFLLRGMETGRGIRPPECMTVYMLRLLHSKPLETPLFLSALIYSLCRQILLIR